MEETNYTILYKMENLNSDNYHYIFQPCYVVKGFYDKENKIFLDEINKERYSYTNSKVIYEENGYCIGDVYNEKELRQKFPNANSLEDIEIKLFEEEETKITIGILDDVNDIITINKVSFDNLSNKNLISENYKKITDQNHQNDIFSNNHKLLKNDNKVTEKIDQFKEIEKELNSKFITFFPDEIENLLSFNNEEDMFKYLTQLIKNYDLYGINKDALVESDNALCVNDVLIRDAVKNKDAEFIDSIINQYYFTLGENDYTEEDDDELIQITLIDPESLGKINDEIFKKIVNFNDIDKVKSDLKALLELCKDNLYNLFAIKEAGYNLFSSITYFNIQVQCLNEMLNKSNIDEIRKYYIALYRATRSNIEKIQKEFETVVEIDEEEKEIEEKDENDINEAIDDAIDKLNELVGLDNVKNTFEEVFSTMLFKKKTEDNLNLENGSKHMVFTGNPGTGKTTVAEIVAPFFHKLGYLKSDKVSYVAAQDLIGKYVGQTAPKTEEVIKKNSGGLIVLDEAYILAGPAQQFGNEAITVMIKEMEKNNTMFIFAGYKKEMEDFIKMNSGIESRIGTFVEFNDYTEEELLEIFKLTVNKTNKSENQDYKLKVSPEVIKKVKEIIHQARGMEDFGNGRFIKKLFTMISREHAKNTRNITDIDELYTITEKDISPDILDKMFFDRNSGSDYKGSNIGFNAKIKTLTKTK